MENALEGLNHVICEVYLDNIIVFSKDITTVLNLARKLSDVFTKVVEVMNAFEKGTLDRHVMRQDYDSVSVEPIKFPIYHLRTFGDQMTDTGGH